MRPGNFLTDVGVTRPGASWRRWLAPLGAAVLVAVLAVALLRGGTSGTSPLVGKPAPDFTLTTLDGRTFRLRDHLGRPMIVNFWASWCVPCREEAPYLRELANDAGNLSLVGVVFQDKPEAARAFVSEFALPFPSVIDSQSRTAIDYGVSGVPETFFIDGRGVIVDKQGGPFTREDLRARARRLGARF